MSAILAYRPLAFRRTDVLHHCRRYLGKRRRSGTRKTDAGGVRRMVTAAGGTYPLSPCSTARCLPLPRAPTSGAWGHHAGFLFSLPATLASAFCLLYRLSAFAASPRHAAPQPWRICILRVSSLPLLGRAVNMRFWTSVPAPVCQTPPFHTVFWTVTPLLAALRWVRPVPRCCHSAATLTLRGHPRLQRVCLLHSQRVLCGTLK